MLTNNFFPADSLQDFVQEMGPSQLQCGRLKWGEKTSFGLRFSRRIPSKMLFKWDFHNCNVGVLRDEKTSFGLHFSRRIPSKIFFKKWVRHNCNVGVLNGMKKLVLDCIFPGGFPPKFCSRNGAFTTAMWAS